MKNQYNICTSCDANLLEQVEIQIYAMSKVLSNDIINFYLMYNANGGMNLKRLKKLCSKLDNINFNAVPIIETSFYKRISRFGGHWPEEAYYYIMAHKIFPDTLDRILYIDAGDVLIIDDIFDYYNADFKGKSLMAHAARFKVKNNELALFSLNDISNEKLLKCILRGLINSGVVLLNLDKMRVQNISYNDCMCLVNNLREIYGRDKTDIYWGDQGLLSFVYIDDMAHYCWPEIKNIFYMPYNFCLWFYDSVHEQPKYKPSIIHFAGVPKPWNMQYINTTHYQKLNKQGKFSDLKIGQAEWYYLWHEYELQCCEFMKTI